MADGIVFTSIAAAHAWLKQEGYDITDRSVRNHIQEGKLPAEKNRTGKVKSIRLIDLERYAKNHLQKIVADPTSDRDRLVKGQADKVEIENKIKLGKLIDRETEEQRDAAILSGFRQHLETSAPDRLQGILADILKLIDDGNLRAAIIARQPGWLEQDMDMLADIFDEFEGA